MEKNIIFLVKSTPFVTLNNYEALRTSISLFDHKICVIWSNDGVFFPLKSSDKMMTQPFLRLAKDLDIRLIVDLNDLACRGFTSNEVINEVELMIHEKILEKLAKANIVISF